MIINILIAVAVIVALYLIIAALQPSEFTITRSATTSAPAEAVFAQVNDFHKWEAWSPWAKLDPNARNSYEGPAAGVGAVCSWSGNMQVGQGRMTIVESRQNESIRLNLDFVKPMKAHNIAEFTFKTAGNQTKITWTMSGKKCFMGKAFGLLMNCDKMVGSMFEKGLAGMKSLAEAAPMETAARK